MYVYVCLSLCVSVCMIVSVCVSVVKLNICFLPSP